MSPSQRRILIVLSLVVALSRLLAVAHSLNDWDEALFSMGVQEYDVDIHHPHPPGYPLFIAAAKGVHFLGVSEFRSLQVVTLLGAFLLLPALFLLAREVGFDFATSICAATIFAFLPNVWIYGGTGFSDIPATTLTFAACGLILRGRRDRRAYVAGAILLGIATGIRTPSLLIGAVPALVATVHRLRNRDYRAVALAALLGGAIAGGSYLGAALSSGTIEQYRDILRSQSDYVRRIDSWRNPNRAPLHDAAKVFWMWPIQQKQQMGWLTLFSCVGLIACVVRKRWSLLLPLLMFVPLMIIAWLEFDIEAAGRYSISYLAAHVLYAACFLRVVGRRPAVQALLAAAMVTVFGVWTWPALHLQRRSDAPGTAALLWVRQHVPEGQLVYVHGALGPHAVFLLPKHRVAIYEDAAKIAHMATNAWAVEPNVLEGATKVWNWPHTNALWKIIRRRNFEASVVRVASLVQFGKGWYLPEGSGEDVFRWMGRESFAVLPPMPGSGRLWMRFNVPLDVVQPPPTIELWLNGELVDRFTGSEALMEKSWVLASRQDAPNELRIVTSDVAVPARSGTSDDTRELGLRVDGLSWTPQR